MYNHEKPLTKSQEDFLKDLYYNKKLLYGGRRLFNYIEENYPDFKPHLYRSQVEKWVGSQEIHQIYLKRPVKEKESRQIYSSTHSKIIQVDLIDFTSRPYKGNNFILVVIDIFSKKLWAKPLRTKTAVEVKSKLNPILNEIKPKVIQTDNGNEFAFQYPDGITHIKSQAYTPQNQGIVERTNGTIKSILNKYFKLTNKNDWPNIIKEVVDNYNDSYNQSIKNTPNNIYKYSEEQIQELASKRNQINKDKDELLELGTRVRIKLPKNNYKKGNPIFSEQIFEIVKRLKGTGNSRNRYKVKEIETGDVFSGTYNNTKLQIINKVDKAPGNSLQKSLTKRKTIKQEREGIKGRMRLREIKDLEEQPVLKESLRPKRK